MTDEIALFIAWLFSFSITSAADMQRCERLGWRVVVYDTDEPGKITVRCEL